MTLSRGGGHDGEFKSRLEMGQGEVKMLAFWGAWKAKTTDVARGEESRPHSGSAGSSPRFVHTVGLRAAHREAAAPSSSPEVGLSPDLKRQQRGQEHPGSGPCRPRHQRLPLTLHFAPQPSQQRAAGPTYQALHPQPSSPQASPWRRLPPSFHASGHALRLRMREVLLRYSGGSAALVTWVAGLKASSAARPPTVHARAPLCSRKQQPGPVCSQFIGGRPTPRQ